LFSYRRTFCIKRKYFLYFLYKKSGAIKKLKTLLAQLVTKFFAIYLTVIYFVSTSVKFGIRIVVGLNGTLVEAKMCTSNFPMELRQNVASHNVYVTFCRSSVPITPYTTMLMPNFALFEAERITVYVVSTPQKTNIPKEKIEQGTWQTTPLVYYSTYQYQ
jgi:hypothetical protein